MKYLILVKGSVKNEYDDKTVEDMNKQLERLQKKHGEEHVKMIKIPQNIGVGYEIYKGGRYYGTIISESESLWHVKKPKDSIPSPFMKETFENRFLSGYFDPIEDIEKENKDKEVK